MIKGITFSAFDLLHAGHVAMLREAKGQCDYLIAGLHVDPSFERDSKNKPIQTLVERYIQLDSLECVDEVIPYETEEDLLNILKLFGIGVRIMGEEYKNSETDRKTKELNIITYFNTRTHDFSSSSLRERIGSIHGKRKD